MDQDDVRGESATIAVEAFRDGRLPRVRAYVAVVCPPERSEETESAALVEFLARAGGGDAPAELLERELLHATRSGAAGRFSVAVPAGHPELELTAECRAMPELLAVYANGGRPEDEALIATHLAGCAACAYTLDRMREAERAFARGVGDLPQLEVEETSVDTTAAAAKPPPVPATKPLPEPEASRMEAPKDRFRAPEAPAESSLAPAEPRPAPTVPRPAPAAPRPSPAVQPHTTYRRRSGGLVGAIRKFARPSGG